MRSTPAGAKRRRRKTAAGARKATARKTATRKTTRRRATSARTATRRRRSAQPAGLQGLLNDLAKRANRAGSTIADLSEGGTDAARRAVDSVSETSRDTIARVGREWDRMDTGRRVRFVAGLLGALAAATAGVRTIARRK